MSSTKFVKQENLLDFGQQESRGLLRAACPSSSSRSACALVLEGCVARYDFNTHLSVLLHVGCESKNKHVKCQTENMKSKSENHIFKQSVAINPGPYICMGARVDALLLS